MPKSDKENIPSHIAIIMDGNRRWARFHDLPDIKGHEKGAETLEKVVEAAEKLGVKTVTVYALSTENIQERAKREVLGLFNLIRKGYTSKKDDTKRSKRYYFGRDRRSPLNCQKDRQSD